VVYLREITLHQYDLPHLFLHPQAASSATTWYLFLDDFLFLISGDGIGVYNNIFLVTEFILLA